MLKKVLFVISGLIGFVGTRLIPTEHKPAVYPALFGLAAVLAVCYGVGYVIARVWKQRANVDSRSCEIFAWASLISWLVPFVGIAASAITYEFSKDSAENESNYYLMSAIAGLASLVHGSIGTYYTLLEQGVIA